MCLLCFINVFFFFFFFCKKIDLVAVYCLATPAVYQEEEVADGRTYIILFVIIVIIP